MSINFYLGESVKYGKSPIVIRVQYRKAGINIRRNTGFSMEPDIWKNRFNIQCLKKYAWIDEIQNTFIQLSKIARTITVMHHEGIHITTDVVKECMFKIKYKEYLAEADEKTFMPFYRYLDQLYIDFNEGKRMTENGTPYRRGTLTSIKQAYDHYKAFEKKSRRKFDYDDINMDFYNKYTNYLTKCGYSQNTIAKNIGWLKTFLSLAEADGYNKNTIYRTRRFKAKKQDVDSIYLTSSDLQKIRSVDLTDKPWGYDIARDKFLIGVLTAQRVSDYNNIKGDDIKIEDKTSDNSKCNDPGHAPNYKIVYFIQKKTNARVPVPCNPELEEIFAKYNNNIPYLSEQKINEYIKEIAKEAGLKEKIKTQKMIGGETIIKYFPKYQMITSHTARRTGATLMYLSGMDVFDIMKITGHKQMETLMKYIKVDKLEIIKKRFHNYDFFKERI